MNHEVIKKISDFIFAESKMEQADVIFIPGNRYPDMALMAAKLYQEGRARLIIPSGRYSILEEKFKGPMYKKQRYCKAYETEADFLEDVLLLEGVKKESILKENLATFTYENALYSKKILEDRGLSINKAIICCKSVHARRCLMYYQWVFQDVSFGVVPVEIEGIRKDDWYLREEGIREVFKEYRRIGEQFELLIKEESFHARIGPGI